MRFVTYRHLARMAAAGVIVLGVSALLGCGGPKKEEGAQAPAETAAPAEQAAPAPETAPAPPAPEAAAPAVAPAGPLLGDPAKGKAIYDTYCVTCHGPGGKGDGPAAATLPKKPADHSDGNYMNPLPNEELYKAVKEGGQAIGKSNAMPPWGATLNDEQVRDVLGYVRSLATPPYSGPK
jgi:cytochrome c oxidase cbb3-type subunit 3